MSAHPGKTPNKFLIRLLHWEYWSFNAVYGWVLPVWVFLCLRARSFFFFNASNPRIENGGFLNESKKDIHAILPDDLYPPTRHFDKGTLGMDVLKGLSEAGLSLPLVGKPDVGGRGRGVKILRSNEEVIDYASTCTMDYHIQQLIEWPNEVGIFYVRLPSEERGRITGIVRKEFLSVIGNGHDKLFDLISADERAVMYKEQVLSGPLKEQADRVIPAGERVLLSPYGNHARGSTFWDDTRLADKALNEMADRLSKRIPDFYFGRLDIRFRDWDALKRGEDMVLLEVNGAGAEPTHMYDPRHSIFKAWREIVKHWVWLLKVSRENHAKGHRYLSWSEGMAMFRKDKELSRKLNDIPF